MEVVKTLDQSINHPYMHTLQRSLIPQKALLEALEKRLVLMRENYASKSEYEKNEIEITRIKTMGEIDVLKRVIREKEQYFIKFMQAFVVDLDECDKNYESVLKTALELAKTNPALDQTLSIVNFEQVKSNEEVRVKLYKYLKKTIDQK